VASREMLEFAVWEMHNKQVFFFLPRVTHLRLFHLWPNPSLLIFFFALSSLLVIKILPLLALSDAAVCYYY
jgi:hypothetical protein